MQIDPPEAPGAPIAIDVHKDECTIKYRAPYKDGGTPILGYFIEIKDELSSKWIRINAERAIPYLECTIVNLVEGSRVQFRVIGLNVAGESQPSFPSDVIVIYEH